MCVSWREVEFVYVRTVGVTPGAFYMSYTAACVYTIYVYTLYKNRTVRVRCISYYSPARRRRRLRRGGRVIFGRESHISCIYTGSERIDGISCASAPVLICITRREIDPSSRLIASRNCKSRIYASVHNRYDNQSTKSLPDRTLRAGIRPWKNRCYHAIVALFAINRHGPVSYLFFYKLNHLFVYGSMIFGSYILFERVEIEYILYK